MFSFVLLIHFALLPAARANKVETAPLLGTQKHSPISVHKCSCRTGTLKDSQIPSSSCEASIHGHVTEFPVYNDICRSIEISGKADGPSETATSYLGPKEVIVGISYGQQNFEISEEWMKAVVAN
ncbi:MAG: hypothetical protein ACXVB9_14455 [Bdellovibrionota bacterium]